MIDTVFYSVWRNCFLRGIIRNKVCQHLLINVSTITELHNNHQYLSLFSEKDKIDNSIYIRLNISDRDEFNQYINSPYKSLANDLKFNDSYTKEGEKSNYIGLDCDQIHKGVARLSCWIDETTSGTSSSLPQSLTELKVYSRHRFSNSFLDSVLSNLPASLRKLELPSDYSITTQVELSHTLVELDYNTTGSNIKKLIVPSNKIFTNCRVTVESIDQLQWIHSHPFVGILRMDQLPIETITCGVIPENILSLDITHHGDVEDGAFPNSIVKLAYRSNSPINKITLPQSLTYLQLDSLSQPLEKGWLPSTLETLQIFNYDLPLLKGVLPDGLKQLILTTFNQQLDTGVIPNSLEDLTLASFNNELKPFVLPEGLLVLDLSEFTGSFVANSLPSSLNSLELGEFEGSFEYAPPMNNLSVLIVNQVNSSAIRVISNTCNLRISCRSIEKGLNLQDTAIQHLQLLLFTSNRLSLSPNLVPKDIQTLRLYRIDIKSSGLIPVSCKKLETDNIDLDLNLIPKSTKHTFNNH
ncbi:hypothetical protein CYY_009211 [Polysphondylium violaceum]|uniref:FNIP repeat-containing protein n=1 Tax=Polysphondylium violaceum TaxID=133409 RepID=A0A8J4UPN5_9MYCE|nr:hypothetical protein CYY_009211 [Polysphondylium violaceum]